MKTDFDILVIGGGMVGACLAALLANSRELRDLRIAVLEPSPPAIPSGDNDIDLRVSAVSRGSQRILESIGAWERIPARHRSDYSEMIVWDASGRPGGAGAVHFSASVTSEPDLGHIVENRRIQWAIHESPAFRARVTVLRAALAQLDFEDDGAIVSIADGRRLKVHVVVGADGADSPSRRLAGIGTSGWQYGQSAFVTHVRTEHPHQRTAWQRFLPSGPIAFLPLADGRSSIVWTTTPEHAQQLVNCSPEQLGAELASAIDHALGAVEADGPRGKFPLRLTHADSYCRDRFVLIGDAAHAIHPLAGQGVNLGFLDGAALVETLEQAFRVSGNVEQLAERRTLRRYERWRKSENALALGLVDGLNRLFSNSSATLTWARRLGLSAVDRSGMAKRFFIDRAMGGGAGAPHIIRALPR